jgi:hypothetical protein
LKEFPKQSNPMQKSAPMDCDKGVLHFRAISDLLVG